MGQAVKYAALGAALVIILALVGTLIGDLTGSDTADGFLSSVTGFLNTAGSYIQSARGVLNYALGQGASVALNILIWLNVLLPLALIPIRVVITVHRFINQ